MKTNTRNPFLAVMKPNPLSRFRSARAGALTSFLLLPLALPVSAVDRTWTGLGADDNWNTPANWDVALAADDRPVFAGSTRLTPVNNFAADTSFAGIMFDAAAAAFTLSSTGNRITLGGNITFSAVPGAAITQTIDLDMLLSATRIITTRDKGAITVGGIIDDGDSSFGLSKTGVNTLTLNGLNTFDGQVTISNGTLGVNRIDNAGAASSLGDATDANSIIRFGSTNAAGTLQYIGETPASTDRQIQIIAAGGGVVQNSATDPTNTLVFTNGTFNAQDPTSATFTLTLGGANTGDNEVQGIIQNNNTGVINLTKRDAGKWIASGANTFSGKVLIDQGILSANTLEDAGTDSSLGSGNSTPEIQLGFGVRTGTLEYTGATTSTNRQIQLGRSNATETGGGVIQNNGGGALTFSNAAFNLPLAGVTATRNLTLGGSNTGLNTISGIIADNDTGTGGLVTLTKESAGTWVLAGANVYNGDTTINGGTLTLGVNSALASSTDIKLGTATLKADASTTNSVSTLDVTGTATINIGAGAVLSFTNSSGVDWTGGTLDITGAFISGSSIFFGVGGLDVAQLGLITLNGSPASFTVNGSGFLATGAVSGYAAWQAANSTTQAAGLDHDNDGVSNGVEHFLFGTADSTGNSNPLPGVTNTAGVLSVTWTKSAGYTGTYGTNFVVETSATLSDPWTAAVEGIGAGFVEISGNNVKYTFPAGTKNFARLKVLAP